MAPEIYAVLRRPTTDGTLADLAAGRADAADPHLEHGDCRLASYLLEQSGAPAGTVSVCRAGSTPASATARVAASGNEEVVPISEECVARLLANGVRALASAGAPLGSAQIEEPALKALGHVSAGIVLVDEQGRLTIREPTNHFGGYNWTYAKGRLDPGETPQQAAHREVFEETGLHARIVGLVGDFQGATGVTRLYVGVRTGGVETLSKETQTIKTVAPFAALELFNVQRDRDALVRLVELVASAVHWKWRIGDENSQCRLVDGRLQCNPATPLEVA